MAIATRPTGADVTEFLDTVTDARRRAEGHAMRELMERVTGAPAVMWGTAIVGFGSRPHTTTAGTYDWMVVGFSPRKGALTLYGIHDGDAPESLYADLGPHTTGVSCLYLKRLDAVDREVLERVVRAAWERASA
jgi:hypothetical protein